ncbi:NnrS family protein [Marinobacter sp.]|uniref:NnrS family protein n=1 Tax=Marinobacter sp. TaxID=50741 RepID=UPI0035633A54
MAGKPFYAFWLFFPAASLWAALAVPLSIFAVTSGTGWPPGLLGAGHGHELIFGFALALVAGYTLGLQPWRVLAPLFLLWITARLFWLMAPSLLISQALSVAFALLLARHVVPRFQAAKKWRNKIAGPLILTICLAALAYALSHYGFPLPDTRSIMQAAILGLLLLMTFIGGRIIAPAVAGTLEKQGVPLEARVQPRIEGTLLILLPVALLCMFTPLTARISGLLLVVCAVLILIRALRWKLWHCPDRPDLLVLAIGYLWLAAGAGVTGLHLLTFSPPLPALHIITIGALGTLSSSVMLRLAWQRAHRSFPPRWQVLTIAIAMTVAVISRYMAGATPYGQPEMLWISAASWSLSYTGVAVQVLLLYRRSVTRLPARNPTL